MTSSSICELPRSITIRDTKSLHGEHKIHMVDLYIGKVHFEAIFNEDYTFIHQEDVYDKNLHHPVYNKVKNDFYHRDRGVMIEYGEYKVTFQTKDERNIKDCISIYAFERIESKNKHDGFITHVNIVDKTHSSFNCIVINDTHEQISTDDVIVTFC